MDSIFSGLLNFGIGGLMAAVVAYFLRHLITVTIPHMAQEHRQALKEVMDGAKELNKTQQELHRSTIEALVTRLEKISDNGSINNARVEELSRHIQANEEHLRLFQNFIMKEPK